MKLNNKAAREMTAEIALTDSELEAVYGGCAPQPPCGGGAPSYSDGGYPSYGQGYGSPSYGQGYGSPSYGQGYGSPSYGQGYGSPFDSSNCGGSGSAPSYTTITYTTVIPSNSSPCNGGY